MTPFDLQSDSPSLANCLPLIGEVTPLDGTVKGSQLASDSPSLENCLPLQRESLEELKGSHLRARRTVGGLRLKTLDYLLRNQEQSGLNHTTRLKREDVAKAVQTTEKTLRAIIKRLESDTYVVRQGSLGGRGESGIVFHVTDAGGKAIKGSHLATAKGVKQGESVPTLVSSSDLKYTTTTDKDLAQRFQLACERFGLHDAGVGANDLLQVWRKGIFQTEEDFLTSLEHIAFYLGTAEAKTLKHPKAWVTSQLSKGFYPAPVGFVSWEERQQEAQLKAKRERLARIEELKRQESDADFEIWFAEASDTDLRAAVSGTPFIERLRSPGAKAVAKEWFSTNRQERA